MKPTLGLTVSGPGAKAPVDALTLLTRQRALVGIPATTAQDRAAALVKLAGGKSTKKKARILKQAALALVNNAELLYIHTMGSPARHLPARPVLEPAIADGMALIEEQLRLAADAGLEGDATKVTVYLNRAGQVAENAARAWFTNSKNNWAPNKPSTIRAKGSSKPLIDTGEMRKAITHIVEAL